MKNRIFTLTLALALGTSLLTSCSWFSSKDKEITADEVKRPVEEVYTEAKAMMDEGRYAKAIEQFQEVERLYPFSPLAIKAQVMEAYSQYKDEEYDKALDVIDEFVALNPGNEEVEFMYYLKAICYYDRIADVKRDQDVTVRAQTAFNELINRFPDGKYARDSKYKLDLIRSQLAAKEMEVGRFYSKHKDYLAAINRYKAVVEDYDDTQQIEEALYRLAEANILLGFDGEALKYTTILGYNYPSSKWYKRAYKMMNGAKADKESKTFVGRVLGNFGLGSEPDSAEPVDLQSSPNLVDTGGWITDDTAISENPADSVTVEKGK